LILPLPYIIVKTAGKYKAKNSIYCLTPKSVKQYGGAKRRPPRSGDKNGEFISPFLLEN